MKSTLFSMMILGLSLNAFAQTRPLPNVQPPKELVSGEFMEGTNTRLSKQDVDQFVPWAQNAQNVLTKALKDSKLMPVRERLNYIENSVRSVVRNSGVKNYQMFMRYSLNRGLLLSEELKKQANIEDIGIRENVLDILVKSINIALSFYESDLSFQRRAQGGNDSIAQDYSRFTLIFARGMLVSIQNVHDASAEYRLLYKMYEMVNWDLSRDPNALNFSDQIVEIYDRLTSVSEFPTQDDEDNLRKIRRLMLLKDSLIALGLNTK